MDTSIAHSLLKEEKINRTSISAVMTESMSSIDSQSRSSSDKANDGLMPPQYVEMLPNGHQPEQQQFAHPAQCYPYHSSSQYPPYVMPQGFYPSWEQGQAGMVPSPTVSLVSGPPVTAPFYNYMGPEYGFNFPFCPPMFPAEACQLQPNPHGVGIAPGFHYSQTENFDGYVRESSYGSGGSRNSRRYQKHSRNRQCFIKRSSSGDAPRKHNTNSRSQSETKYDENMTVFQFKGKIVDIAKELDGSRFIQDRLDRMVPSELQLVFQEIIPKMNELVDQPYANFILQKLMDVGTDEMKMAIGVELKSNVAELATQTFGCRVVQKAFDVLDREDAADLALLLKGNILQCINDKNGNHVIQKAIVILNTHAEKSSDLDVDPSYKKLLSSLSMLVDEVVAHIEDISKHPFGCRVVQRMIEKFVGKQRNIILDNIMKRHEQLLDDQYGNYVVQRVITYGRSFDRRALLETITRDDNILVLSKQKHASNVVESMLKSGSREEFKHIAHAILSCKDKQVGGKLEHAAVSMAQDQYANYVIKTALDLLEEGEQRDRLCALLVSSLAVLESSPYAKHILSRTNTYSLRSET